MSPATLEKVSAAEAPVRLSLLGLPVFACAKGHRSPVHRDFMVWLMRELRDKQVPAIPGGEAKGMLFKKYHCACGAELPSQAAREASFGFELAYPEAAPFRGEIAVPVYKCGSCGKELARSAKEIAGATPAAVAALNDAAGFPHSG
ncbi:MAG TPA: hypothetical protein VF876_03500 [Burkholderiales bacterium]